MCHMSMGFVNSWENRNGCVIVAKKFAFIFQSGRISGDEKKNSFPLFTPLNGVLAHTHNWFQNKTMHNGSSNEGVNIFYFHLYFRF